MTYDINARLHECLTPASSRTCNFGFIALATFVHAEQTTVCSAVPVSAVFSKLDAGSGLRPMFVIE